MFSTIHIHKYYFAKVGFLYEYRKIYLVVRCQLSNGQS